MVSFEDATSNFVKWLVRENVRISDKLDIKDFRDINQGRGLVATQDIEEEEDLFIIPRSVLLNVENCTLIEHKPELREKLLVLDQWKSLIIVLLYEIKICKEGKWGPYFNVLPIADEKNYVFNQLMFWSDQELENLKPSLILERVGKDLASAMYDSLFPSIAIDELGLKELANVTAEDFHKVASLIMSYSFDVEAPTSANNTNSGVEEDSSDEDDEIFNEGTKSMVPLADTLNADTNLHNASLFYTGDVLVMRSIKAIKKGKQVFNTYSDHPNSEILRRYGYVEPQGSKYDFAEIPLSRIKRFFVEVRDCSESLLDEVTEILTKIVSKEQEDGDAIEIVLGSYDCFKNYPMIIEFVVVLQILTVIASINGLGPKYLSSYDANYQLVNRIYKKCHQLIESGTYTKLFIENAKRIIQLRMDEYPTSSKQDLVGEYKSDRKYFADVVLKSEYQSLKNSLELESYLNRESGQYKVIDDEKLIRNIMRKRTSEEANSVDKSKKQKF